MAKAAPVPASCANCRFYRPHRINLTPEMRERALEHGQDVRGDCRRFPDYVKRAAEDWCGEHRERD